MLSGQALSHMTECLRDGIAVTEENKKRIDRLYEILNMLEPCGDDERHEIWFTLPRGGIDEFYEYEDMLADGSVESYAEYVEMWKEEFPDETMWFKLTTVRYKEYVSLFINGNIFIEVDPRKQENRWLQDMTESIETLTAKATETVEMVRNGTYNDWLNKELPYTHRFGTIPTQTYLKLRPDEKPFIVGDFPDELLDSLREWVRQDGEYDYKQPPQTGLMPSMTVNTYLELSAIAYRALYPGDAKGKTPEQMYKRWADDRDGGFLKVPHDDPDEFMKWYKLEDKWVIDNPSHLWEAVSGGSRTNIHLSPHYVEGQGWYFVLSQCTYICPEEAATMYVALRNAGIPVRLCDANEIIRKMSGEGSVGIIPWYSSPWEYQYGGFPVNGVLKFVNLELPDDQDICDATEWLPLDEVKLADANSAV